MDGISAGVLAVIGLALFFNYTNGFHDSANAIATSVHTRALTPKIALSMAAIANLVGAFFGAKVADTVGRGIIEAPAGTAGLALCAGALIGAIAWNLLTWWLGLPSSSTHALIGGLVGATLAAGADVKWGGILDSVVIPMVASPMAGLLLAGLVFLLIRRIFRDANPAEVGRGFRYAQTVSATAMAFGHGMQDAAKVAGVIVLGLTVGGQQAPSDRGIPFWVLLSCAVALSLGTYAGGWRIMRTLGRRIVDLRPAQGFAAEVSAATILYVATALRVPVSSTHAITSAIVGVGATEGVRAIRFRVVREIGLSWLLTAPGAALIAALAYGLIRLAI